MFRMCSIRYLWASMSYTWCIVCLEWSRKSRSTPCFPCCRLFPSTARWTDWMRALVVSLLAMLLCSGDSQTGESFCGLPFCGCDRVLGQLSGAILALWSLFHRDRFPCSFHRACQNDRRTFSRRSLSCPSVRNSSSASVQFLCGAIGDWYILLYNSSPDFLTVTFSIHIGGEVL